MRSSLHPRTDVASSPGPALAHGGTRAPTKVTPMTHTLIRPHVVHGEKDAPEEMARLRATAADAHAGLARLQEAAARQHLDRVEHQVDAARRSLAAATHDVDMADTAHLTATIRTYLEQKTP